MNLKCWLGGRDVDSVSSLGFCAHRYGFVGVNLHASLLDKIASVKEHSLHQSLLVI